jgi:hypothetical protein
MTRRRQAPKQDRRFVVWSHRRESPDTRKLARTLLAVVLAEQRRNEPGSNREEAIADER